MPYVRFSRDKRGYENTYVLYTPQSMGEAKPRLLYWFRTPPDVGVGRLALDEDALRSLEARNPGVTFDWTQILKARPQAPGRGADAPSSAKRRSDQKRSTGGAAPRGTTGRESNALRRARQPGAARPERPSGPTPVGMDEAEPVVSPPSSEAAAVAAYPEGQPEPSHPADTHPVVALLGREALVRLRTRFAELDAKIAQLASPATRASVSTDPRQPSIYTRLQRLNPDHWQTVEDAVTGIERFDTELDALARQLD